MDLGVLAAVEHWLQCRKRWSEPWCLVGETRLKITHSFAPHGRSQKPVESAPTLSKMWNFPSALSDKRGISSWEPNGAKAISSEHCKGTVISKGQVALLATLKEFVLSKPGNKAQKTKNGHISPLQAVRISVYSYGMTRDHVSSQRYQTPFCTTSHGQPCAFPTLSWLCWRHVCRGKPSAGASEEADPRSSLHSRRWFQDF